VLHKYNLITRVKTEISDILKNPVTSEIYGACRSVHADG
jgi:hypothetical protein